MHDVVILVRGYVEESLAGRQRAAGTVTLVRGEPNVVVDTGDPWQRNEILDALASQDLDPADIQVVVNTHGHLDHVGNNNLFPHATFLLDTDVARHGEYWTHDFARGPFLIEPISAGEPIAVVATPGHTDHDLTVMVRTPRGLVAIAGDLFEHAGDDRDGSWRRWSRDAERQLASRANVLELADFIVPGHGDIFPTAATATARVLSPERKLS
jgi:glyoxylase-like metal-dependent hydrolase (beta-lactamase superfamily II)